MNTSDKVDAVYYIHFIHFQKTVPIIIELKMQNPTNNSITSSVMPIKFTFLLRFYKYTHPVRSFNFVPVIIPSLMLKYNIKYFNYFKAINSTLRIRHSCTWKFTMGQRHKQRPNITVKYAKKVSLRPRNVLNVQFIFIFLKYFN